jgi:small subunit ribosomal protein S2
VYDVVKKNGRVLFVGTKQQASDPLAEAAKRCGQYYVNFRWLGGMLTNWKTVSKSISTLRDVEKQLEEYEVNGGLTKKEALEMSRRRDKLRRSLGGIMDMGGKPDLLVVIDTNREDIAIQEAKKLGIPVIAILDSNSSPEGVDYPVPGNDDAIRSIQLYCKLFSDAALAGIQESVRSSGVDIGASKELPKEVLPKEVLPKEVVPAGNDNASAKIAEKEAPASKTTTKKAELKAVKVEVEKADAKAEKPAADKKPVAKKPVVKKAPAKKAAE